MEFDLGRKSIAEWAQDAPEGDPDLTPAQEKFVVEMPIGSGGMGEVFLGEEGAMYVCCDQHPKTPSRR